MPTIRESIFHMKVTDKNLLLSTTYAQLYNCILSTNTKPCESLNKRCNSKNNKFHETTLVSPNSAVFVTPYMANGTSGW